MPLARWEPLAEMEQMRRNLERTFERMMPRISWAPTLAAENAMMPEVDVYEHNGSMVMTAELPGLEAKDVNVEISEDSITLSGEMRRESEMKEENVYRCERQYGAFTRTLQLPDKIDDKKAKATFKNGVLTVKAPLAEGARRPTRHKVPIESQ